METQGKICQIEFTASSIVVESLDFPNRPLFRFVDLLLRGHPHALAPT